MKARLAQRDLKLAHYHLAGKTAEQTFTFDYRAPNRMRGALVAPARRTFSFDGATLYELSPSDKTLTVYENQLPPEKSAEFLTRIFSPFVPEGIRAPLFSSEWTATREGENVRLKSPTGSLLLRWGPMDFLERATLADQTVVSRATRESCDKNRCVPTELTTTIDGAPGPVTILTEVDFDAELPVEQFTLAAPAGWSTVHHQLVATPASGLATAPAR